MKSSDAERGSSSSGYVVLTLIAVIVILNIAQAIFIPIALAILLSFILTPLIIKLCQWKFPKFLAIFTSVGLAFSLIGLLGWMLSHQVMQLAQNVPTYQANIRLKIQELKNMTPEVFDRFTNIKNVLNQEDKSIDAKIGSNGGQKNKPILVKLVPPQQSIIEQISSVLNPLLGPLGTFLLVIIFVIAILFHREDLRARFIILISQGDLNLATQAIDDATTRIIKYLLMNLLVNTLYGLSIGIGLFYIGIPNALLGGFLATLLKFIPYLGVWLAASFPLLLAFSVDSGWSMLLMTMGLFAVIELISNYFLEPRLYGTSTGISSIAIMVASVFWTWIWGVVGLFLSVPLTVCIFMLGKYVPGLEFLEVLLGSDPVFKPEAVLYQRLLAMDEGEALRLSNEFLKDASLCDYYDLLMIPALTLAEKDLHRGTLAEHRQKFILEQTGEIIDSLNVNEVDEQKSETNLQEELIPNVICLPVRDESDELAARMLAQLLNNDGIKTRVIECVSLSEETYTILNTLRPKITCISSLLPYSLSHVRSMCKKIKQILPETKIVVSIWGVTSSSSLLEKRVGGCDAIVFSLKEATTQIKLLLGLEKVVSTPSSSISSHEIELLKWLQNEDFLNVLPQELCTVVIKKIAKTFDVPVSLVSVIETDPHFWKSYPSLIIEIDEARENLLKTPVCEYVISEKKTLVVENIQQDSRFAKNPWLCDRGILFYAGTPLKSLTGHIVGIVCVVDTKPRDIKEEEQILLETLAEVLMQKCIN